MPGRRRCHSRKQKLPLKLFFSLGRFFSDFHFENFCKDHSGVASPNFSLVSTIERRTLQSEATGLYLGEQPANGGAGASTRDEMRAPIRAPNTALKLLASVPHSSALASRSTPCHRFSSKYEKTGRAACFYLAVWRGEKRAVLLVLAPAFSKCPYKRSRAPNFSCEMLDLACKSVKIPLHSKGLGVIGGDLRL